MNKKSIKIILSFLIMLFCIGIKEVRAEDDKYAVYPIYNQNGIEIGKFYVIYDDTPGNEKLINTGYNVLDFGAYSIEGDGGLTAENREAFFNAIKTTGNPPITLYYELKTILDPMTSDVLKMGTYFNTSFVKNFQTDSNTNIYARTSQLASPIQTPETPETPSVPGTNGEGNSSNCGILPTKIVDFLKEIFNIFKIVVPIIIVSFGILDFTKAVFSGDESQMKKAQGKFVKRLIYGLIFFIIPLVLGAAIDIINQAFGTSWGTCGIQ